MRPHRSGTERLAPVNPSAPDKTFPVSWWELHRDAKALAWRLMSAGSFKGIIAITRGGMVPAAIIARELEIRLIETLCIASYDDRAQGRAQIIKGVEGDGTRSAERR